MADEAAQQANRSGMDPRRLVVIFYLLAGITLALFLDHVLGQIWAKLGWGDPDLIEGLSQWKVSTLVAYALALAIALGCFFNPRVAALSADTASELMKVTWPTWAETRASTLAVVVASLVSAVLLFAIDRLAYEMMVNWIPTLWGKL